MSDVSSPKASRQSRPRWLDPKLFLGILLVLTSMAVGARVVAMADDKSPVLVAAEDVAEGADLNADMFEQVNVGFESGDDANRYVGGNDTIPKNARAVRAIGQGELLPRDAMTTQADASLADMPIPIGDTSTPTPLSKGDKVDIWVVPGGDAESQPPTDPDSGETPPGAGVRVMNNATVMTLPEGGGFASGGGASGVITVRFELDDNDWTLVDEFDVQDDGFTQREMEAITDFLAEGTVFVVKHVAPKTLGD